MLLQKKKKENIWIKIHIKCFIEIFKILNNIILYKI